MPLLLLVVSAANSLTFGAFIWCLGVLQAGLFTMIIFKRKYSAIIAPIMMTIGGCIAAYVYITIGKSDGANALLEMTGAKTSSWSEKGISWVSQFGFWGLFAANLSPAPTAMCVIIGLTANIPDFQIILAFCLSRFLKTTGTTMLQKGMLGADTTLEDILRGKVNFDGQRKPEEKPDKND